MNKFKFAKGQALLQALVAAGVLSIVAVSVPGFVKFLNKGQFKLRIKNQMIHEAARFRRVLSNTKYWVCTNPGPNCVVTDNTILIKEIEEVFKPIPIIGGGEITFDKLTLKQTEPPSVLIEYHGGPGNLKVAPLKVTVPERSKFSQALDGCPTTHPVYIGTDSSGQGLCAKIFQENCPAGEVLTNIDSIELTNPTTTDPNFVISLPTKSNSTESLKFTTLRSVCRKIQNSPLYCNGGSLNKTAPSNTSPKQILTQITGWQDKGSDGIGPVGTCVDPANPPTGDATRFEWISFNDCLVPLNQTQGFEGKNWLCAKIDPADSTKAVSKSSNTSIDVSTLSLQDGWEEEYCLAPSNPKPAPIISTTACTPVNNRHRDAFPYPNNTIDLLFVVDNSGSMKDNQDRLADNFDKFINEFSKSKIDFQIGVVSTDTTGLEYNKSRTIIKSRNTEGYWNNKGPWVYHNGYPYKNIVEYRAGSLLAKKGSGTVPDNQRVLTSAMTDLVDQFKGNVRLGIKGSGAETGLASAEAAMASATKSAAIESWNRGLFRPGSYFSVIVVSDEDENLKWSNRKYVRKKGDSARERARNTQNRINRFKTVLKEFRPTRSNLNVIVDLGPDSGPGCSRKRRGTLYESAAKQLGGVAMSICQDFGISLSTIALDLIEKTRRIPLSKTPVVSTIKVVMNGAEVPSSTSNGFVYHPATNEVSLNGSYIPPVGATGYVEYDIAPDELKLKTQLGTSRINLN